MTGLFNNPRRHLRTLIKQARKEKDSAKRNKKYDEALEYGHGIEKKLEHDPDIAFIIGTIYYIKGDSEKTSVTFTGIPCSEKLLQAFRPSPVIGHLTTT